jgi:hypothetical protein
MTDHAPCRRRFQFRLRTLMIGVTIVAALCAYLSHERQVVQERQNFIASHPRLPHIVYNAEPQFMTEISWIRRWMSDRQYYAIAVGDSASDATLDRFKRLFPEAAVVRSPSDKVFARFEGRTN